VVVVVAQVPALVGLVREPEVPVLVGRVRVPGLAADHPLREPVAPLLAELAVRVPAVLARLAVLAHLVVEPAERLPSRQSSSAAMAGTTT
jgi:hypothetical protein